MKRFKSLLILVVLMLRWGLAGQAQEPPPAYERELFDGLNKFGGVPIDNEHKISGSAFWNSEWVTAYLFDYEGRPYGAFPVKVNLLEQKVHYLNSRKVEMVAKEESLKRVEIRDAVDTGKILTAFEYNIPEVEHQLKQKNNLVQELNQGSIKLLKVDRRKVESADSLFGTMKRYFYSDDAFYFIGNGQKVEKIKRLSADFILPHIPLASKYKAWIKEQNINFKLEEDCVRFLTYYNSREGTIP